MARAIEDRFWEKVDRSGGPDACWIWTASTGRGGYGQIAVNGCPARAHRVAWELTNGPIPEGIWVLHNCPGGDNRLCVNPAHLWLGTVADNARDMAKKDRVQHGPTHYSAKLTEDQVLLLRADYVRGTFGYQRIAMKYGITRSTAEKIVKRTTWSRV